MAKILTLLALSYLIGSIPFAVLISRLMGLSDPRSFGSGNPGATNVLRSGNKFAALLTLVGDAAKGGLVVCLASYFATELGISVGQQAMIAFAAFLGHVFSVFLRFKGGKGVATAAGVLLGISPLLGVAVMGVWVAVAALSRYSSAAALSAAVAAPIIAHLFLQSPAWTTCSLGMSAILIWRHKANISRLLAGTEGKIGKKKAASTSET
ncbi:glycerol-3-phosphate 1-O-acyltransferase PlsY [Uliginosibacterium gangwonense]|uniref:glycerol-3-phosphate 1-O-acyltransferase PlsY n=1 Tax=Uliginosibacterium gangwonense TaxID=392736 RepID=UPI00035D707F|nr:glycerol-3-phosphate 1-O-acyltransferase PlsY [Uliginosibacterium gangwonense]